MLSAGTVAPDRQLLICIVLLWLCGAALRLTILAVPPVIPLIRADLGFSATEVGFLSSLPVVLFALAALPGSLLIARLGTRTTLIWGLLFVTIGSALRGASWEAATLYGTTVIMGIGVAIMQPTMPTAARQWLPSRVSFGTAVYSNGLLVGEILPVALAFSVVMPLVNQSWRLELAVWALPIALIALLVAVFAPRTFQVASNLAPQAWWPNWRESLIWKLGLLLGSINAIYYATNAFLPEYLSRLGRGDLIDGALTALNLGQLPASLVMLVAAGKVERRAWPYIVASVVATTSVIGLVFMVGTWTIAWAAVLGCAEGAALTLGLTLPPLLSQQQDVGRTSAAMFMLSYAMAVAVALASGAVWDITGTPGLAFAPIVFCAISMGVSALLLKSGRQLR
jgi:CP family cyanate transporter-like MFS transporter